MRIENQVDEAIVRAWLDAARDLGIHVTAPFSLVSTSGNTEVYDVLIHDFGGPRGTLAGRVIGYHGDPAESRSKAGYYASNLSHSYRHYDRELFIATLDDWGWYGEKDQQPSWYTGRPWS